MPNVSDNNDRGQLVLPFPDSADYFRDYLVRETGRNISLTVTDNSTSMISIKTKGVDICVRLHRIFLSAGPDVIDEIAGFVQNRKGRIPLVRRFITQNSGLLRKSPPRISRIKTLGKYYDLTALFESVNNEYFGKGISASVTWGKKNRRRMPAKRTLGSYCPRTNTIRINPVLDRKTVPDYFIGFIVYHEMLHADMGVCRINGRRSVHSSEFRKRERMFKEYEKALAWEKHMYMM